MKKILACVCALTLMLGAASCVKNSSEKAAEEANDAQTGATTQQCDSTCTDEECPDSIAGLCGYGPNSGVSVITASGLEYRVIKEGDNTRKPGPTSVVKVKYTGKHLDGTVFDSSEGQPIEFPLNGVIAGFSEGIQLMSPGAIYELIIPAELAYGERGAGDVIAPNETLVFVVELVDFK